MSKLKGNIISLLLLQASNYIIPILTIPYLTRVLGVEQYGMYGMILSISQYFVLFIDFGFNLTASKRVAVNKENKNELSNIFISTISAKLILLIISLLVMFAFIEHYQSYDLLLFTIVQLIGAVLNPIWFFQGLERIKLFTISSIIARVSLLPLLFILVKDSKDIGVALFIQSSILLITGAIGLFIISRNAYITYITPSLKNAIEYLKGSVSIYIAGLAISLYSISTPIILNLTSSIDQVGIFVGADKLKVAILGVFLVLGHAFYPRVNVLYKESTQKAFKFINKIFYLQGVSTIVLSLFIYFFSDYIVKLALGSDFSDAGLILKILSPLIFLITQSVILANYILLPLGHDRIYTRIPLFTSVMHLLFCYYLGGMYGAVGGAVSILIIESITFMILCYTVYKKGYLIRVVRWW